jgi:zinc transporter 2
MGVEIAGGFIAGSLAIMTDAAHMFSDFTGFFISIFSIWIGTRPSTKTLSYGFHRAEIIGALVSVVIIWGLTIWLIVEAFFRVLN